MNKEKIKQIVLDIIAEIAPDEDLSEVKSDIRLRDQLDLDSMDFLDIVMELRKQHGIDVPSEYRNWIFRQFRKLLLQSLNLERKAAGFS